MNEFAEGMPTATITLDKPREIGFTLGALRRIKEKLGSVEFNPADDDIERVVPVYIWCCLPASGRLELSPERIEDLIYPGNMQHVIAALTDLFVRSLPEVKENPTPAGEVPAMAPT